MAEGHHGDGLPKARCRVPAGRKRVTISAGREHTGNGPTALHSSFTAAVIVTSGSSQSFAPLLDHAIIAFSPTSPGTGRRPRVLVYRRGSRAEDRLGLPTMSASVATTYEILDRLGLDPVVPDAGRLLSGKLPSAATH